VGNQSRPETISFETSPGLIRPGQRIIAGTRKAPSQLVSFSLRNCVVAASGHDHWLGPLSVEYTTMVLLAMPRSSTALSNLPTSPSCSIMPSAYSLPGIPLWPIISGRTWVNTCIRVVFIQTKNGLPDLLCRLMYSMAAAVVSSSMVSIRLRVKGPVSSQLCLPTRPQCGCSVASSLSVALHFITPRGELVLV